MSKLQLSFSFELKQCFLKVSGSRRYLSTTKALDRVNIEFKCHILVNALFTKKASCLSLVSVMIMEISDVKKYLIADGADYLKLQDNLVVIGE